MITQINGMGASESFANDSGIVPDSMKHLRPPGSIFKIRMSMPGVFTGILT